MSHATLTVWKFDTADGADEASATLDELARAELLSLLDAATVSWPEDKKKPRTRQLGATGSKGALGGAFWGMLFGLIFFVPLLGAALGAAAGALTASMADVGIDDRFINKVRDEITPGTSALFLLTTDAVIDKVRDAFVGHGHSELIFTNLTSEQESALREVFAQD